MNENTVQPSLFGLASSNRDFSQANSWGKNQFNNSFPASVACYMHSQGLHTAVVKNALSTISFGDVEAWLDKVFGQSTLSKRKTLFSSEHEDTKTV